LGGNERDAPLVEKRGGGGGKRDGRDDFRPHIGGGKGEWFRGGLVRPMEKGRAAHRLNSEKEKERKEWVASASIFSGKGEKGPCAYRYLRQGAAQKKKEPRHRGPSGGINYLVSKGKEKGKSPSTTETRGGKKNRSYPGKKGEKARPFPDERGDSL